MADLISGPLTDGVAEQALGSDAFQSTTGMFAGATAGAAWDSNPTVDLFHNLRRSFNDSQQGPDPSVSFPTDPRTAGSDIDEMEQERGPAPVRNTIQPDDANTLAKQQGAQVTFDSPITPDSAQSVIDDHLTAQRRAKTIQNYQGGILSKVAGFGISSLVGLADPLNLAAFAIPAAPEAFVAEKLAMAGGMFERGAIRGAAGAVNGAAGMAALQPLQYAMDKADYNDYSAGEALRNILFGAVMGGVSHAALGGLFGHDIETRDAAGRAAVGQVLDDRPVDVADIVNYGNATQAADRLEQWHAQQTRILDQADKARQGADFTAAPDRAGEIDAATENLSSLREQARGMRGDIETARAKSVEGGMDADTSARLDQVNQELGGVIPKARRAALEQERSMLMEGRGTMDVSGGDPLEQARTAAQVQGLSAAADRTEATAAEAEQHLADMKEQAAQEQAQAQNARDSSNRSDRISQAKQDSQEAVLQNLMEREVRKYAANIGTTLEGGEAATIAKEIRTAQPAEAQEIIQGHLATLAKRSGKSALADTIMNPPGSRPTGPLTAEAQAAARSMAQRTTADKPVSEAVQSDARLNRATVESAPKIEAKVSDQLNEATKMVQDAHNQLQAELKSGRIMETQAMRDAMLKADEHENIGKAAAGYAQCLAARGF